MQRGEQVCFDELRGQLVPVLAPEVVEVITVGRWYVAEWL